MDVPPDIASVIKKTAAYVFKNGTSFEERLKKNSTNEQFEFLDDLNKYYPYYQQQLAILSKNSQPGSNDSLSETPPVRVLRSESTPITVRPLRFITRWDQPPLAYDDQIMKLTAMFVAKNGDEYGSALYEHKKSDGNGPQFAFMDTGHTYYPNYINYVESYRKIIKYMEEGEDNMEELLDINDDQEPLQRGILRALYKKHNRQAKKASKEKEKQQKLNFASIDWQDFVFVARIEFDLIDQVKELAVPVTRDSLINRSLQAKSEEVEPKKKEEMVPETTEPETKDDPQRNDDTQSKVFKGMKIKAAGESRLKKPLSSTRTITCPLTGRQIPEHQFESHIQVLLRDPRYKEQQDNYIKKNFSHSSNITTDQVYENIVRLTSKKRPAQEQEQDRKKVQQGQVHIGPTT
ncbi:SF3a splicing factor complex subunit [Scheffersomyces spartinae]|uniref:SF3a splicing factor complex subunit n=1 Tax=Scheffersomyces spartinae TaxID=45513 RepID=A0A9P7VAX2_9ASCO|nr:SF3a splicing factor complex subunit [Scheffersomyces spartinae]KAG7194420.1 SF3a splicing factor complex subunit [Scheffersomyces spartinae]